MVKAWPARQRGLQDRRHPSVPETSKSLPAPQQGDGQLLEGDLRRPGIPGQGQKDLSSPFPKGGVLSRNQVDVLNQQLHAEPAPDLRQEVPVTFPHAPRGDNQIRCHRLQPIRNEVRIISGDSQRKAFPPWS